MKISFPFTFAGSGSDVWTYNIAEQLKINGIDTEVTVFPKHFQYYPYLLKSQYDAKDADIVHTNSWTSLGFMDNDCPHVATEHLVVHDPAVSPYKNFAQKVFHSIVFQHEKKAFEKVSGITAVSQYSADRVTEYFNQPAQAIHNGVDTLKFFKKDPDQQLDPRGNGKIKLLFVGNFSRRKGADLLPQIMQKLGPSFVLFTTTGLQEKKVTEASNIFSIGKKNQQELLEYYNYCDIFLFPTRLEGLSLTALEAMSCGMPLVTTDCFSMPELVLDGQGGYLCEKDNVEQFVESVRKIADMKDRGQPMGIFNRERVENSFSLELMTNKYIALYESLL